MRRHALLAAYAWLGPIALAGCITTPRTFTCPRAGGPPWHEISSEHFILHTDLPSAEAGRLLGRVERLRAALVAGLPGGTTPASGRVDVIAFRTAEEYQPFSPGNTFGYYIRYDGGSPRIVIPGEFGPLQHAMLAHEITHDLLAAKYKRRPRWFAEGLAVYMETVRDGADGTVTVGGAPRERLDTARSSRVSVSELLRWDGSPGQRQMLDYYAGSWLLVHWLVHARPAAFETMGRLLAAGVAPETAWRAALPDVDPDDPQALLALDGALTVYLQGRLPTEERECHSPAAVGYFEQDLSTPEMHAIRLEIWQFGAGKDVRRLRAEVQETLQEDPANPTALEYLAGLDRVDPLPLARRAVAGHPNDPRAHIFLASALQGPAHAAEREQAFRRAAELAPRNPAALHNLADELFASGKLGEALPVAEKAAALAPWSTPILAGYAAVLSGLGRCSEAIRIQQRAIEAIPDRDTDAQRNALSRTLAAYADTCRLAGEGGRVGQ
ncbi:MAG TPA: tetratricopeptide repeat protein [Anaeromyxobacteraceae bacterium]|nr:tetratricopeptide repeat protein [Anaeromyxobacteraceae bacterium]